MSLRRADKAFLGGDRIGLLEAIDRFGSIARAAREVGVSYKTAWDAVDAMNNAAERPLVDRAAGGVGGGGTVLTDEGKETVRLYRVLRASIKGLSDASRSGWGTWAASTRWSEGGHASQRAERVPGKGGGGPERCRQHGGDRCSQGGETLCSVITNESAGVLDLKAGMEAYAFFKASAVILGKDLHDAKVSARNLLCGTVDRIVHGPVNAEVPWLFREGAS